MNTIFCTKCKTEKHIDLFHKNKTRPTGYNGHCKECQKKAIKKAEQTLVGVARHIFASQKRSSQKRKQELPLYTLKELIEYIKEDIVFLDIFDKWVKYGYKTLEKPSYDRINYDKPYSFDNIRAMSFYENWDRQNKDKTNQSAKNRKSYKTKVSAIIEGKETVFESINLAGKAVGLSNPQDIRHSITRNGTAGGFKWKYV